MTRIFFTLAIFSLVMVLAALGLGLTMGDLRQSPDEGLLRHATVHRLTGVAAALSVVFVNSIVITYFVGTSRWCKEVVATYSLDIDLVVRSNRIKRATFPWAVITMLCVVGMIALGAAADPSTGRAGTENWTIVHLYGALGGIAFIAWSYLRQWNNIQANHVVINEVMDQVRQIRDERGLENDEPADSTLRA